MIILFNKIPSSNIRCLLIAVITVVNLNVCLGQESNLFAINNPDSSSSVLLKWYSQDFVYPEGVNIYRKRNTDAIWEKINESPINQKNNLTTNAEPEDSDLNFLEGLFLDQETSVDEIQESFLFVNVLLMSIQSAEYADFLGIYYEDKTATLGETYTYRANRISQGKEYLIGESKPLLIGDYVPEPSVKGLKVYQEEEKVYFDWEIEDDRYYAVNVYRTKGDSVEEKVNPKPMVISQVEDSLGNLVFPSPVFSQDSLEENAMYVYQVVALGFFNEEFERSAPNKFRFADTTPPVPPKTLESKHDSMRVKLNWIANISEDVQGLNIYRSKNSEGPYELLNKDLLDVELVEYADLVDVHGPYYYKVGAVDFSGNEGLSEYTFVKVPDIFPPIAPTGLTIKSDTGRMELNWNRNPEGDVKGYLVYRTTNSDIEVDYLLLNADPIDSTYFLQELPINVKNNFYYKIAAMDTSFNIGPYSDFAKAAMPDVVAPERPFIKNTKMIDGKIEIHWVRNVEDDLLAYTIQRRDTISNTEYSNIATDIGREMSSYLDLTAYDGILYEYRLLAKDSAGNFSKPSATATAYLPKKGRDIVVENVKVKHKKKRKINTITWDELDEEVLGYVVYAGANESALKPLTGLLLNNNYVDVGIEDGKNYFYQIRAYQSTGNQGASKVFEWKN